MSALLANLLFGESSLVEIARVEATDSGLLIFAKTVRADANCTACGGQSQRVHSRYTRVLRDLAIAAQPVTVHLQVRRFKCENSGCLRRIFAESINDIAGRFQRSTARALGAQQRIALALGGEAGSRLARFLGLPVSGDSLLRRLTAMSPPQMTAAKVIGVDDWAIRRGQTYGTLICDLQRKCPIAMLDNRSADSLTEWLQAHPEVEVISRDRAGEYAKAASAGAPQAIQVADRWHLLRNSTDALAKVIEPRQKEINSAIASVAIERTEPATRQVDTRNSISSESTAGGSPQTAQRAVPADKAAKYEAVVELSKKGHSQRAITRLTRLNRKRVARYLASDNYPVRRTSPRKKRVSRFKDQIEGFIESGIDNITEIHRRLTEQGFTGSYYMVRRYLKTSRTKTPTVARKLTPRVELWSTRKTAWLLSSSSGELSKQDAVRVQAISEACPDIKIAADLTSRFAKMVRERNRSDFESWICEAIEPNVPKPIRSFAANLMKDQAAVEAALEHPWSNGQLEGQINRLKMLKRQMYGRASLKLLECRVLNAA